MTAEPQYDRYYADLDTERDCVRCGATRHRDAMTRDGRGDWVCWPSECGWPGNETISVIDYGVLPEWVISSGVTRFAATSPPYNANVHWADAKAEFGQRCTTGWGETAQAALDAALALAEVKRHTPCEAWELPDETGVPGADEPYAATEPDEDARYEAERETAMEAGAA